MCIVQQLMGCRVTCLVVSQFGPPFPCIVGVDVPEPSMPVPVCKSSTYGDWEDPACGTIECVG